MREIYCCETSESDDREDCVEQIQQNTLLIVN